jgi:hypothetical protein
MSFELIFETQARGGWDRSHLPTTPESVEAALVDLGAGVIGSLVLKSGAEELWVSGGPEWFNVWAATGPDHFFDLVGDRNAKGSRQLVVGGQNSDAPARHCVTKDRALQEFWRFLASNHIEVSGDHWERQGSHADAD